MKAYLFITGALFALTGIYCIIDPVAALAPFGMHFDSINGLNQIRGTAGGVTLATGIFMLAGTHFPRLAAPSLWMVMVMLLGLEAGRVASIVTDGWPGAIIWLHVGFELLALVPAALILWLDPKPTYA